MTIAATYHVGGAVRTRTMKLPAACAACRTGIKTAAVCSDTAASRPTAITKCRKSKILQNVLPWRKSVIASMASPHVLVFGAWQRTLGAGQLSKGLRRMTISKIDCKAACKPARPANFAPLPQRSKLPATLGRWAAARYNGRNDFDHRRLAGEGTTKTC